MTFYLLTFYLIWSDAELQIEFGGIQLHLPASPDKKSLLVLKNISKDLLDTWPKKLAQLRFLFDIKTSTPTECWKKVDNCEIVRK